VNPICTYCKKPIEFYFGVTLHSECAEKLRKAGKCLFCFKSVRKCNEEVINGVHVSCSKANMERVFKNPQANLIPLK